MRKPLTRVELDAGRCMIEHEHGEVCGASGPLFITQACHPGTGVDAEYEDGVIEFVCHACKLLIVQVRVAARTPPPPPPRRHQRRR